MAEFFEKIKKKSYQFFYLRQFKNKPIKAEELKSQTLNSTDFVSCEMSRFFFDSAAATPITATIRNLWMGEKSSQATASSRLSPPLTVRAELASSAFISRPSNDTHARFLLETGSLGLVKLLESRRGEGEGIERNALRETNAGGGGIWAICAAEREPEPGPKPGSLSASCMRGFEFLKESSENKRRSVITGTLLNWNWIFFFFLGFWGNFILIGEIWIEWISELLLLFVFNWIL